MASSAPIHEAKDQFTRLISRAEAGERITITRHGKSVAQISPEPPSTPAGMDDWGRELVRLLHEELGEGTTLPGVPEDFDDPMPDEFWCPDEASA